MVSARLRPAVKTFTDLKQETTQRVRVMTLLTYYKVHYLRVYSWQQADRVMSTETGISILKTVDNTTDLAEIMLDKYLPPPEEEIQTETGIIFLLSFLHNFNMIKLLLPYYTL